MPSTFPTHPLAVLPLKLWRPRWFDGVPAAEYVLHAVGIVGMLAVALHIGRRRLVRRWYGAPQAMRPRPALFWTVVGAVAVPTVALTPFLPAAFLPHTTGARVLGAIGGGLLAGAAAVGIRNGRGAPDRAHAPSP